MKKVISISGIRKLSSKKMLEGFRLFDICILNNLVSSLACQNCHECCPHLDEDHNKRKGLAVYACRTIGAGYDGLEKVCGMMNMPRPMTKKNFDKMSLVLGSSAQAVAESSMSAILLL